MDAPAPRRVAVVVVPGVGDDAPGDTLDAAVGALAGLDELGDGVRQQIVVRVGEAQPYRTSRVVMPGRGGGPDLHVYELCWSDISRFPGRLRALAATLVGLLLQLCTVGLESLRGLRGGLRGDETFAERLRQARRRPVEAAHLAMEASGWLLAVPVLLVTGELALLAAAAVLSTAFDGSPAGQWVSLILMAALSLALAWWAGRRLRARGWWRAAEAALAVAAAGVARVAVLVLVDGADPAAATANALIIAFAYPFRIAWLLVCVAVLVSLIALARLARLGPAPARAATTGVLTTVLAPGALALVATVAFAAIGAAAVTAFGGEGRDAATAGRLLCLPAPGSFRLERCVEIDAARAAAAIPGEWGLRLFAQALVPLLATAAGALLLTLVLCRAAAPVLWHLVGPSGVRTPEGQWRALTGALHRLTGRAARVVTGVVAAVTVVAASALWIAPGALGSDDLAHAAAAASVLAAALLVLVRYVGLGRPAALTASATGPLELLRRALDLLYDIATYLRVGHRRGRGGRPVDQPRELMLQRYRALLRHVADGGFDRLVIAGHSQGTVLSAAALFGDPFREDPADRGLPAGLPASLAFLTMGSPLRQIYGERFPGAYDWVADAGATGRIAPLTAWVNLFRAGDYVGRALWHHDPPAGRPWDLPSAPGEWHPGRSPVHDVCLGPGGHTGYFGERPVAEWIHRLAAAQDAEAPAPASAPAPDGRSPVPVT